jgi:hypothetical protein
MFTNIHEAIVAISAINLAIPRVALRLTPASFIGYSHGSR